MLPQQNLAHLTDVTTLEKDKDSENLEKAIMCVYVCVCVVYVQIYVCIYINPDSSLTMASTFWLQIRVIG